MTCLHALTSAEQRVGDLLQEGLSNKAIAHRLVLSIRTVESHISSALAKTGCENRVQLALLLIAKAGQRGDPCEGDHVK